MVHCFGKMFCLHLQGDNLFHVAVSARSFLCDLVEELQEYMQLNSSHCDSLKTVYWGRWMQKGMVVLKQGHKEGVLLIMLAVRNLCRLGPNFKRFCRPPCILKVVLLVFIN